MRSDFGKGHENEGALVKTGMRDFEAGQVEDEIAVEDKVEVKGARTLGDAGGTIAAEFLLDFKQLAQEFEWREQGFESEHGVEEARLVDEADGGGGVERGAGRDAAKV